MELFNNHNIFYFFCGFILHMIYKIVINHKNKSNDLDYRKLYDAKEEEILALIEKINHLNSVNKNYDAMQQYINKLETTIEENNKNA